MSKTFLLFFLIIGTSQTLFGQQSRAVGTVKDVITGQPIEFVTVYIDQTSRAVETDANGRYSIVLTNDINQVLVYSRLGYQEYRLPINDVKVGDVYQFDISLSPAESDIEVIVRESRIDQGTLIQEDVEELKLIPSTTGNLESVLPAIALGTSGGTGGELSSQYNVRGGNYDENLVYINGFEIYRPQLIRAGQQEGLSFPNIDLMRSLSFSSGGFQAKYGDKMSSVLDIQYKRPDSTRASVSGSLLGATAHLEGSAGIGQSQYQRFRYLVGARYKTNAYLLGSLNTKGEYVPNFVDLQTYLTYDVNRDWQIAVLGNYNRSIYNFEPIERSTAFGLVDFTLELNSAFEGGQSDDFATAMGGLAITYLPDRAQNPYFLKFMASSYISNENERFDILGFYRLSQIETSLGSEDQGEEIFLLGTGTQHLYTRNLLQLNVYNFEHKGGYELQLENTLTKTKTHFFEWSLKYQVEDIDDRLNEWERLDSAGYSLPASESEVLIRNVLKTKNQLRSARYSAYIQDTYTFLQPRRSEIKLTAGVRATYWDLNKELVISPRFQFLYKPLGGPNISYRLAAGLYAQTPFYRELRRRDGTVNTDLKAQKSFHAVAGFTWDFRQGKRKTKYRFITEAYYKSLWDLVSYDIDNVRIRYSGENDASGDVLGLDMRLNGEFVEGAESWINLSILRARESLDGVQHIRIEEGGENRQEVSDVPRPSDQLITLAIFFQDYLPRNENIKMHFNFSFGSGLPFGIPENNEVIRNPFRFKEYQRVDIGFSALLWNSSWRDKHPKHVFRGTDNVWASLEVFNLLQVANVASNTWIKSIFNTQYAVKNFLTSRRINLRFRVDF